MSAVQPNEYTLQGGNLTFTYSFSSFMPPLANFFFLQPYYSFSFGPNAFVQVFLFVLVSLLITSVALQKSAAEMAALKSQSQLAETLRTALFPTALTGPSTT
ncbi:MAG: DUF4118 domain-containing protein [Candidatus Angelobacter sp.]